MVTNTPETRAVAEVVQSMVAEAGFDLKIAGHRGGDQR